MVIDSYDVGCYGICKTSAQCVNRFLEHGTPLTMMDQSQDGFHGLE